MAIKNISVEQIMDRTGVNRKTAHARLSKYRRGLRPESALWAPPRRKGIYADLADGRCLYADDLIEAVGLSQDGATKRITSFNRGEINEEVLLSKPWQFNIGRPSQARDHNLAKIKPNGSWEEMHIHPRGIVGGRSSSAMARVMS